MERKELTETIIGCAYRVYNAMGFGFLESVYEKCLLIELGKAGLQAQAQVPVKVHYENLIVGDFIADVIVEKSIIIELKSVTKLNRAHEVQLVNYLKVTGIHVGLLINFGESGVEVKRKIKDLKRKFGQDLQDQQD